MKAENISNSNFVSKYENCFEIFAEYFVFFPLFKFFFWKFKFFKKNYKLTSEFKIITHSKHWKLKLHEGLKWVKST